MWPERAKPRTKDFVREWQYVLSSLGSGPDGGRREKSRAEAHERGGKGEATAEHWCCGQYSWAHLFLYLEAFYLSRASSLFSLLSFFSFHSLYLPQHFFPISSHSPTFFDLSLPLYPVIFLFHLPPSGLCFSCLPFSHCQMAFPKAYANLYLCQHL